MGSGNSYWGKINSAYRPVFSHDPHSTIPNPLPYLPMNTWAWVALGGAVGAVARYGVALAFAPLAARAGFPLGILAINVLGSFLLGLTVALVGRGVWPEVARLAFGTGVLGAFTTFSTFSVDVDELLGRGADCKLGWRVTLPLLRNAPP